MPERCHRGVARIDPQTDAEPLFLREVQKTGGKKLEDITSEEGLEKPAIKVCDFGPALARRTFGGEIP